MELYLEKNFIDNNSNDLIFKSFIMNNLVKKPSKCKLFLKQCFDYLWGMCGLLLFIVIYIPIAYKIKKESPGKVLFFQKRVGLDNQEFECIKFRTMHEIEQESFAFSNGNTDPRIFKFGQFMRKTRIDEIPQFLNILKGEMSLIGPRPERKYWTDQFEQQIQNYQKRHLMKPGITGLAQVLYRYGENLEDAKQKLMYDLYYIKNYSLWLDFKIILKTILIVLTQKGK